MQPQPFRERDTRKINTTPKQNLKRTISLLKEIISLNLSSKLLIRPEDMAEKERLKSTLVEKKEEFTTLCTTHAFHLALNESKEPMIWQKISEEVERATAPIVAARKNKVVLERYPEKDLSKTTPAEFDALYTSCMAEKAIDALQELHNESSIGRDQDKETWEAEFKQKVVIWFETQLSLFNAPLFQTFPEAKTLQFAALLTGLKKYLPQNRLEHFERYYNLLPPKEKEYAALLSSYNSPENKIAEIKKLFSSAPGGIDSSSKELYYSAIAHLINEEKISLTNLVKETSFNRRRAFTTCSPFKICQLKRFCKYIRCCRINQKLFES